jgi:anti-sigma regulatory factor (Ser/Thr protein kinase)
LSSTKADYSSNGGGRPVLQPDAKLFSSGLSDTLPAKHTIFLYESEAECVSVLHPFVEAGLDAGEAVITVASPSNLRALRESLGPTPPTAYFVDGAEWYARPPDTMGRWVSFVEDALGAGKPGARIIGEVVWPADPALHWEMKRFEAASTLAWTSRPALVVCPYNTPTLPDSVIEAGVMTHPGVIEHGGASLNTRHVPPERMVLESLPSLSSPSDAFRLRVELAQVVAAGDFVEARARLAGLHEYRVQEVVAAVGEVVSNAFRHAKTSVDIAVWTEGGRLVCQIEDEGAGVEDPAVGYQPPFGEDRRVGLWLARQRSASIEVGRGTRGAAVRLTAEMSAPVSGRIQSRL